LPQLRSLGKIVIAITHDDNYFDVADAVVKMSEGKMERVSVADGLAVPRVHSGQ
jgi:putative pyoverdin transport system ATP-binding/permease protein